MRGAKSCLALVLLLHFACLTSAQVTVKLYLMNRLKWDSNTYDQVFNKVVLQTINDRCKNNGTLAICKETLSSSQNLVRYTEGYPKNDGAIYLDLSFSIQSNLAVMSTLDSQGIILDARTALNDQLKAVIIRIGKNEFSPPPPFTANIVLSILACFVTLIAALIAFILTKKYDHHVQIPANDDEEPVSEEIILKALSPTKV